MAKEEKSLSAIQVAIRIRPILENEMQNGYSSQLMNIQNNLIQVAKTKEIENQQQQFERNFQFDQIFDKQTSQQDVYESLKLKQLASKVINGYNGTVFAYGQTGSGKTYTMEGYNYTKVQSHNKQPTQGGNGSISRKEKESTKLVPNIEEAFESNNQGLIPRIIQDVFKEAKLKEDQKHISICCSFLQIYQERIFDLLNPSQSLIQLSKLKEQENCNLSNVYPSLRLRWNKQDQFSVENLYYFECDSVQQMLDYYHQGMKNKIMSSHSLNQQSSRSHSIFTITVEAINKNNLKEVALSKLQMVDLAGSEKSSVTEQNNQKHLKESVCINKSLFVLRKVISLVSKLSHGSNNIVGGNGVISNEKSKINLGSIKKQSLQSIYSQQQPLTENAQLYIPY